MAAKRQTIEPLDTEKKTEASVSTGERNQAKTATPKLPTAEAAER